MLDKYLHLAPIDARRAALPVLNAIAAAALLAACGGGSSDGHPAGGPAAVTITGVVSDGPLQGATACYDLNDNGACDSGEPVSSLTDASGNYAITVAPSAAGAHAVVVDVPASAVDQTTGAPIGTALVFRAPATSNNGTHNVFVSPLTTLVVSQMHATGMSAADAAAFLQAQAGLALSPLADFVGVTPEQRQAAMLARLSVQTQIAILNALSPQVGTQASNGTTITAADIAAASQRALLGALPALAAMAASTAITGAGDVQAALVAAAQELVASLAALDPAQALTTIQAAKLSPGTTNLNAPGAALRGFEYTDANNWTLRYMASSAADNTPDAQGLVRFYDVHKSNTAGVIATWGFGTLASRAGDLHWSGSGWVGCPLGIRSTQTPRDAQGRATYNYCDSFEIGTSTRTALDIAGQTMSSVITNLIRPTPGEDNGVRYANWGPADLSLLGNTAFPSGAELLYQTSVPTTNAIGYDVTSPVTTFGPAAAAGGNAAGLPLQQQTAIACRQAFNGALTASNVATLEELVANNPGIVCSVDGQVDANGSSLNPNMWWSATSASLGNVANGATQPAGTGTFYTTTANLRVAFTGGNAVKYYSCYVRTSGGGTGRNCLQIGTGTFTIRTLGDGRVMTFENLPPIAQRLGSARVFVERGGTVYFGYRAWDNVARTTVRLNLDAANALLGVLGLAPIVP